MAGMDTAGGMGASRPAAFGNERQTSGMHDRSIEPWMHDHTFGQDKKVPGEGKTLLVVAITALTMVVEILAGLAYNSMALFADGVHMASHASALTISVLAYYYTRRHARDPQYNFGTGKVNSLAAFASSILLVVIGLYMAYESVRNLAQGNAIECGPAILVAVVGLAVNGLCLVVLGGHGHSHGGRGHGQGTGGHAHGGDAVAGQDHAHPHPHPHPHLHAHPHPHGVEVAREGYAPAHGPGGHGDHKDHNLMAAYLHVLADAMTSVLAILALLAIAKYPGVKWLDPVMGIVGAVLVVRWSMGLLRISSRVLLDVQAPEPVRRAVAAAIESRGDHRVSDLHIWSVGPGIYAAEVAVVAREPLDPDDYLALLPPDTGIVHLTVEPHRCAQPPVRAV